MNRHAGALATELDSRNAETPELCLLGAVLSLAIKDARRGDRDALAWIASDEARSDGGLPFALVCEALDVSPAWIREQVAAGARARRSVMRFRRLEAA